MSDERVESLKAAIGQIERQFGKGAVMRIGRRGPKGENRGQFPPGLLSLGPGTWE